MATCIPKSHAEVAARVQQIYGIVRSERFCSGPLGLLKDRPTAKADKTRAAKRLCGMAAVRALGFDIEWSPRQEAVAAVGSAHINVSISRHSTLQLGNASSPVMFMAQHYWDLIIYDLFFKGAPPRPRYFFEAGARNGAAESNTLFFERYLGWSGILVEPSPLHACTIPYLRPRATSVHGAFCRTSFRANAYNELPPACDVRPEDYWPTCFPTWAAFEAAHGLRARRRPIDFWSLDIDNDSEQLRLLHEIDWSGDLAPSVLLIECKTNICERILQKHGYKTLVLENNGKLSYWGDVLAWKDTCAAWR